MSETIIRKREEIPQEFRWNAESVFASREAWEAEYRSIPEGLPALVAYQGRLAEGPTVVASALEARDELIKRAYKVLVYAGVSHAVDTTDQAASAMNSQAVGPIGQVMAAASFIHPELLAIGGETLLRWAGEEPRLAVYRHYLEDLLRQQEHVRSAEVEELLGMLIEPFSAVSDTENVLTNADFQFPPATAADGTQVPLAQGTLDKILSGSDREARRTAWENYQDVYLAHKNALASNLAASIKQNVFGSRARRHASTLEATLFDPNIPTAVFHNLLDVFRANLPTWHRYWAIRRRALGVAELQPYDIWAPLTDRRPQFTYQEAVDSISQALAPLGQDYVEVLRRGCLEERWVDVYPNAGKTAGAFSSGSPGTHPFIVMSFDGELGRVSTLAHELGHSMHSYYTRLRQPIIYSDYSMFVAETASNFHQAMLRAYLLEHNPDPDFQISVIEEAMDNFHRYFFIMPTLARFELDMHQRAERGQGLSAEEMNERMADLFAEGYGQEMHMDRARTGITWATFSHLYVDYYVFQYATGISAANSLSRRVLAGGPRAAAAYRSFLEAGSSVYPLEALRMAGVDMATPQPVEETFALLGELVGRLERLLAAKQPVGTAGH